jgi:hypothetical protein
LYCQNVQQRMHNTKQIDEFVHILAFCHSTKSSMRTGQAPEGIDKDVLKYNNYDITFSVIITEVFTNLIDELQQHVPHIPVYELLVFSLQIDLHPLFEIIFKPTVKN